MIASGTTDMQVANQIGHRKIETTKEHLRSLVRSGPPFILKAITKP
jgi:hypothetical protein